MAEAWPRVVQSADGRAHGRRVRSANVNAAIWSRSRSVSAMSSQPLSSRARHTGSIVKTQVRSPHWNARHSADTLVIARTDAVAVEGFTAAIERAALYRAAGADMLFGLSVLIRGTPEVG